MRHIITRVIEILHRDFEYSEFQGSCIAIVWGLWFLFPGAQGFLGTIQSKIARVQDLRLIGLVALGLGACQLVALLQNDLKYRRIVSFWAVMFWSYNFAVAAAVNARDVLTPLLFLYASGAAWAYWRLGRILRANG